MAGETATTTAHPRPWVCPTPDLDIKNVQWAAYEIKPGTTYHDEPNEMIPAGWYVLGYYDEHDDRDAPPITIKIEGAYDEHGCDRGAEVAQYVAATLTLAAYAERERRLSRGARLRRAAGDVARFVGEAFGR